ncbi:autotransporter-associated beta strand repeat-containing protein [Mucisphaera sp.]|uniref:autotransporter-associated beta strand repeat-containing protein n=1 Tax=Mucisphaera sp. TaxID=2913024 RepID=UPI003D1406E7
MSCKCFAFAAIVSSLVAPSLSHAQPYFDPNNYNPIDLSTVDPFAINSILDPNQSAFGSNIGGYEFNTTTGSLTVLNTGLAPIAIYNNVAATVTTQQSSSGFPSFTGVRPVKVFTFNHINLRSRQLRVVGDNPLAILSYGDADLSNVTVNVIGGNGGINNRGTGGTGIAGGGNGSSDINQSYEIVVSPSGFVASGSNEAQPHFFLAGGTGGLRGRVGSNTGGGGAGGGAIEIGALGHLSIANVIANGGHGRDGEDNPFIDNSEGGDGGAGGTIRLHANTLNLQGSLFAEGGNGGGFTQADPSPGMAGDGGKITIRLNDYRGQQLSTTVQAGLGDTEDQFHNPASNGSATLEFNTYTIPAGQFQTLRANTTGFGGVPLKDNLSYEVTLQNDANLFLEKPLPENPTRINLETNATLWLDANTNTEFDTRITGSGAVHIAGNADHRITGIGNNYTGGTFIENGTLVTNSSFGLGAGPVVIDGGTLAVEPIFSFTSSGLINGGPTFTDKGGGIDVRNNNQIFRWSQQLTHNGPLYKYGPGNLQLDDANNSHAGPTRLVEGTIQVSQESALGNGMLITTDGRLEIRNDDTTTRHYHIHESLDINISNQFWQLTHDGPITGDGELIKSGNGTLKLTDNNTYLGGTRITNGTLIVSNTTGSATGSADVNLEPGTTLGGNGSIAGSVSIDAATISPGESIGQLTLNKANFRTGSKLIIEVGDTTLGPGLGFDQLVILDNLEIANATLQIDTLPAFNPLLDQTITVLAAARLNPGNEFTLLPPPDQNWSILHDTTSDIIQLFFSAEAAIPGDVDLSGDLTLNDLDLLHTAIATNDTTLDLNNDTLINTADAIFWLETLYGTAPGDTNLDLTVDLIDLSNLATNFNTPATSNAQGDFNADATVDLIDLSLLATNFGFNANPIPEPTSSFLLATMGALLRRAS